MNLPKKSGREILKEIKQHEKLKRVPVIVLTISDDKNDINGSYDIFSFQLICNGAGVTGSK